MDCGPVEVEIPEGPRDTVLDGALDRRTASGGRNYAHCIVYVMIR